MRHIKKRHINFGNEQKICTICSVPLEIKEAGSLNGNCYESNYDNRIYKCNTCVQKKQYQLTRQKRKEKTVGSTQHIYDMLSAARRRAKKYHVSYTLKVQDLREVMTDVCPILGIKLELNKQNREWGIEKNKNNWQTSPSIDRIIPDDGYIKDNIIIVSLMANAIKNQATPDQIQKVATFYKKLYKERKKL